MSAAGRFVAIAGNPNSGKTTIFNQLTGLRQKVANYPGVTVEKAAGILRVEGWDCTVVDLPGTYSVHPRSPEEKIACEVLCGLQPDLGPPCGVVCVVDSTNLERNLYLALQVREIGLPMLLVLNMADEVRERGGRIDCAKLEAQLGVPVVATVASRGHGLDEIRKFVAKHVRVERVPIVLSRPATTPDPSEVERKYSQSRSIVGSCQAGPLKENRIQELIDRAVTHGVSGTAIFLLVVALVFEAMFRGARPAMTLIQQALAWLSGAVSARVENPLLRSLAADGLISGVGSVLTFLPQIFVLFFFISVLEDSGYMARAAFLMDRLMSKAGLQGKSFLPLLSSYACAIPGIMACRTIENKNDRLATMMIAPLMTCSARLPVYALLIAAFVPPTPLLGGIVSLPSAVLFCLYGLGFGIAILVAKILKSSVLKSHDSGFVLELPPYRVPNACTVFSAVWNRSRMFLQRAGTVILAISLLLWTLATFPHPGDIRTSFAAQFGELMEPLLRPLGFDWRIGIGIISSFAAREVIVSSLATLYGVQGGAGATLAESLRQEMTPLTAISLLVFFALACQCMSTLAVVRRETNGWRWPLFLFGYMSVLAYLLSLAVYQCGLWLSAAGYQLSAIG